jgi:hypothetical protein
MPKRSLLTAGGLILFALALELVSIVYLSPHTFVIFAFIGVPALLAGVGVFVVALWRHVGTQMRRGSP